MKIPKGRGRGQRPRKFGRKGGCKVSRGPLGISLQIGLSIQLFRNPFLPTKQNFHMKNGRIIIELHFRSSKNKPLHGTRCHYLLQVHTESVTLQTEKHWRLAQFVFASVKISFLTKVEMMVQIHKLEIFSVLRIQWKLYHIHKGSKSCRKVI